MAEMRRGSTERPPTSRLASRVTRPTAPGRPDIPRSLRQQRLSPLLQSLDQAVGAAGGDDRGELVAPRREIADGSVEIDVDHVPAADQVVDVHRPPAGLQQAGLDDFAAPTRFRNRLRFDDEFFPRIIVYLARIVRHDE